MDSILDDIKKGNFVLTIHAQERMSLRMVSFEDILHVGHTAVNLQKLEDGKYQLDGFDSNNKRLVVICAKFKKTIIITIFHKSRRRK